MRITKRQLRRLIREAMAPTEDLYVVIGNLGRGQQTMWPKAEQPGVYSKTEADNIAKDNNKDSRLPGGMRISWHVQPLSQDLLGGRYGVLPGNTAYGALMDLLADYSMLREAGDPNLPRADEPIEVVDEVEFGDWGMGPNVIKDPDRPWGSYAKKGGGSYRDTIVMSPNGDSVLVDGRETYITDVPKQLEYTSGFEMSDVDADNLIFALETQEQDGYVELGVEYKDGKWSW